MRNAKKTLSLVMVAIFTTFIVLSGIPAGAVTTAQAKAQVTKATAAVVKVENVVKVASFNPTTAQTLNTAATKEVAKVNKLGKTYKATYLKLVTRYQAVNKKITARKAAILAASKKVYTDAEAAVTAAENATDGDKVDLVGDETALANAQSAVTTALEMIVKLNQDSSDYKGLMARIDAANNLIVKAMDEIAEAAAQKAIDDKLKAEAEAAAKALEAAIKVAETDVAALEAAPVTTLAEIDAAVVLGTKAAASVKAIANAEKAAPFAARIKVVADKGLAVKAAIEAKIAAELEAKKPATMLTVSAVDGTLSLTFDKKAVTTPVAADFTVKKAVDGAAATAVTGVTVNVVSDTAVTLVVPATVKTTKDQSVVYSVAYTTGAAITAAAYKVALDPALVAKEAAEAEAKIPATMVSVSAVDGTITVTFTKKPITTPAAVQFVVTKTVTTTSAVTTTVADVKIASVSDTAVTLSVPAVVALVGVDQKVEYSVVYNATGAAVSAKAVTIAKIPELTATVTALNLKQVKVTFSKEVDATEGAKLANYFIGADSTTNLADGPGATVVLEADKLSAIVTLENGQTFANSSTANYVKILKAVGFTADYVNTALAAVDTAVPTVVSVKQAGPKTIDIVFSEPLNRNVSAANTVASFVLDDGTITLDPSVATYVDSTRTLTIGSYTNFSAGNHKLTFKAPLTSNLVDYAGYKVLGQDVSFAYAADTTTPVATLVSSTETTATIKFNKPVVNVVNNTNLLFSHTYNSSAYQVTGTSVTNAVGDNMTFVVNFGTAKPFIPGTSTLFIGYASTTGTLIADSYGNTVGATSLAITTTVDVVKPTVVSAVFTSATVLTVTFSETVDATTATTAANYTLKDSAGAAVAVTNAALDGTAKVVTLTTATMGGGSYTLKVASVKDASIAGNVIVETTLPITATDTIVPTVVDKVAGGAVSVYKVSTTKVKVEFSEAMDATLLADKANWMYNGQPLLADDTITVATDKKSVIVYIAATVADANDLTLGHVKDLAGNYITLFSTTLDILPLATIPATSLKATGLTTVVVGFDQVISGAITTDFEVSVDNGTTWAYPTGFAGVSTVDGKTSITLITPNQTTTTGNYVKVRTVSAAATPGAATNAKNEYATAVQFASTLLTTADGYAPAIVGKQILDTNANNQLDTVRVIYSEPLQVSSVAYDAFTVAGYTVSNVVVSANVVTLTITELTTNDLAARPLVQQVKAVRDNSANFNSLAAETAGSAATVATGVTAGAVAVVQGNAGTAQVETATVGGAATAGAAVIVTVTKAGVPAITNVPVLNLDSAIVIAGKIRAALTVAGYTVGGAGAEVILTSTTTAANDATLNIAIDGTTNTTGVPDAANSANTTAGVVNVTETATMTVTAGATTSGVIKVTVNGADHYVAVVAADSAAVVAGKIRTQLTLDTVTGYTVGGAGADVVLTSTTASTNVADATASVQ